MPHHVRSLLAAGEVVDPLVGEVQSGGAGHVEVKFVAVNKAGGRGRNGRITCKTGLSVIIFRRGQHSPMGKNGAGVF